MKSKERMLRALNLEKPDRLPATIRAFIPEHHGTLEASFQYLAAIEPAGGSSQPDDRRDFAYPGPRPRTREAALLMLADGVEAKARAENPSDTAGTSTVFRPWSACGRTTGSDSSS